MLSGHPANITSAYPVTSFDLVSTYIECAVTSAASVGVPQQCTLQFKGTKTDGTTAVPALCSYFGSVGYQKSSYSSPAKCFQCQSLYIEEISRSIEETSFVRRRRVQPIRAAHASSNQLNDGLIRYDSAYSESPLNRHYFLTVTLNLNLKVILKLIISDQKFVATSQNISRNII